MNVNFEYAKSLTGEGSVLLLLSLVPYVGWILGIVGVVLLLRGMKELSGYYQDDKIYHQTFTGVKYYVIAIIAAGVAIASITLGVWSATGFDFTKVFVFTLGFGVGLAIFFAGLISAVVFYILATLHLRQTFRNLADKSGEGSFRTAGDLLWWGALLSIVLIGFLLIFVAWIFATIGFFTMKPRNYQPYPQQTNGAAQVSGQAGAGGAI